MSLVNRGYRRPSQAFLVTRGKDEFVLVPPTADYQEEMATIDDMLLTETLRNNNLARRSSIQIIGRPMFGRMPVC